MTARRAAIGIWAAALVVYVAFAAWYGGFGAKLRPEEIDAYLARVAANAERDPAQLATLRAFLEADDGGEFFMVNLVRLQPGEVAVPGGSEVEPAARVLERYTGPFLGALLRRAGHPAFGAPAVGGYVEHWGVEPDPGWSFAGIVRYRSRRDLVELVVDPAFEPAHVHKRAAIANTLAFPASPARAWVGPRIWVGLVLALLAALAHLVVQTRAGSRMGRES